MQHSKVSNVASHAGFEDKIKQKEFSFVLS